MFLIVLIAHILLFPLIIINGILGWIKENISLVYVIFVILSIPIKIPLAFMYLVLYSILEHFNYSKVEQMENPEEIIKY